MFKKFVPKTSTEPVVMPTPEPNRAEAEQHERLILNMGGARYALDFWSAASKLKLVDAEVIPITSPSAKKRS